MGEEDKVYMGVEGTTRRMQKENMWLVGMSVLEMEGRKKYLVS